MARRVIGLDLGAYSVKLVRLLCGKQTPKFEVQNVVEEVLSHEADEKNLLDKQKEAILKFHDMGILEAETFAIGFSGSFGQMRTMQVPFLDTRKLEAVLPGLLEAEVPFEIEDMIVSWHRLQDVSSAIKGEEKSEFANVRVAFGKKPAIAQTLQMLQTFSIDPRIMHLSSIAPYELVREFGFDAFLPRDIPGKEENPDSNALSAIIDFGHRATNLCIFDRRGLKYSRTFLRGGKKLSEEIANALAIPFVDAERLKHEKVHLSKPFEDKDAKIINDLALAHHHELLDDILRTFITMKTGGFGVVQSVALIGGGTKPKGFLEFFLKPFNDQNVSIVSLENILPDKISSSTVLPFAYALSCLQIHAKESRFNFRKDEFTWRGDLDFLRIKSTPLILWGLVLVCTLTVMWWTSSLVLEKENKHIANQLKTVCSEILGQKNVAPKKCLAEMKAQISSNVEMGVPEFSATDVYLETAAFLPKDLNITISELDVSEKKVRIVAKTTSFEDVEKVYTHLTKIPCFVKVEKGRAQQLDGSVEFHLSSDIDCNASRVKSKAKS